MNSRFNKLRQDNRTLCESRTRLAVSETLSVMVGERASASASIAEAIKSGQNPRFKLGKVGQADQNNENNRIYPRKEWLVNIERVNKETGPQGIMVGAVDHQGCGEGGNLKTSPILWRKLEIDDAGGVFGEFEVIKDHTAGKDLLAQIEAGMKVGFSTFGYATAHRPSKEEAEKYGLEYDEGVEDDEYDGPVIIDNWELVKIDAVDNPAVRDARLVRDQRGGVIRLESINQGAKSPENNPMDIKTLEDLKANLPAVFALHQAALDALQAKLSALESTEKKYGAIVKKLGESLLCLAQEHGAPMPLKDGAQVNKDLEANVAELTAQVADAKRAAQAKDAEKAELQKKLDAIEAEKAQLSRKAEVNSKADQLLKDSRFADLLRESIAARIDDPKFDLAAVEALVKEETARAEKILKLAGEASSPERKGSTERAQDSITGLTSLTDRVDDLADEDGIVGEAKPLACLVAE